MACKITSKIERNVAMIDENRTVLEATKLMLQWRVGIVVIVNDDGVTGVFTERDLMKRVIGGGKDPVVTSLTEVLTKNLITVSHKSSCRECLNLMRENRCRHLLVYDNKQFIGVVTLRDVAQLVGSQSAVKESFLNLFGGIILFLLLTSIGLLIYMAPEMLKLADRLFT